MSRKLQQITCQLCGETHPSNGIHTHLRYKHDGMTTAQYMEKFGDFRTNTKKAEQLKDGKPLYKCNLCGDDKTYTATALSFHLIKQHGTDKEAYIRDHILNGVNPVCKCGCGKPTKINSYSPPYATEYISGHNSIGAGNPNYKKTSTLSTREKMRLRALERIKNTAGTLPMHSPAAIQKRGEMQTGRFIAKVQSENDVLILCQEADGHECYYKIKCNKCGTEFEQFHQSYFECPVCYPRCKSRIETDIIDYLSSLDATLKIIHNNRHIIPGNLELDLYFPDKKIAIEIDGLFWHSELRGKDKMYHLNKTVECEKLGVHLIHVFEDEWELNRSMVLHKIGQRLGIFSGKKHYARNCTVRPIAFQDCKQFLELNHLQGGDISPVRLGLFSGDDLVSVMTFSKPNTSRGSRSGPASVGVYELSRFATKENVICIGGGGKLLTHFLRSHKPNKIISYADRRWSSSTSNVYMKLGFTLSCKSDPCYWYFKPNERRRFHRFNFTKRKTLELGGDPTKTEWQNMQELGYDRIWDCGHLKYELIPAPLS